MANRGEHNPGYSEAFKRRVADAYLDLVAEGGSGGEIAELARGWGVGSKMPRRWALELKQLKRSRRIER